MYADGSSPSAMKTLWFVLGLLNVAGLCHADRDIVYAARYYAPPGSHGAGSHFHIYRINPDGSGKTQLTFGMTDQSDPRWSPDGKQIIFIAYSANSDAATLCRIDADGRNQRVLRSLGAGETLPAPPTPGYKLEPANSAADTETYTLIALKTGKRLPVTVSEHGVGPDALLPMPGGGLVYAANERNSTSHENYFFYRLDAATGKLRYLTEGQFLAWSPDGSRFCAAPCRDTTRYEKRKSPFAVAPGDPAEYRSDAAYRLVWAAPLYVRAAGGPMKQITPRLSYVTGADWRKGT